jgi:D-alanyl-D-alanine carboxypeptidase/D-alanyl-D-alanine-endopeptidase (penicillin-binding protein 4)
MDAMKRLPVSGWICLNLCLALCGLATPASAAAPDLGKTLANLVEKYRDASGASVGLYVVNLADEAVVCDADGDKLLTPASNQKLITSAVVMKRLGPDFKFRTRLVLEGKDLAVYADGDPTLGDPVLAHDREESIYAAFDRWVAAVKKAGITRVEGNLVVRAGLFSGPMIHPDWPKDQLKSWYSAPVAAASFNDNCMDVSFKPAGKGFRPALSPESDFFAVTNKTTAGATHSWDLVYGTSPLKMTLVGSVSGASSKPVSVAFPDPPAMFACVLADRLAMGGVAIDGKITVSNNDSDAAGPPADAKLIAVEETPLIDALSRANKQSLNMMAECLFIRSGVEGGRPSSWAVAAETARKVLVRDYGLTEKQFTVTDGSGLSRADRVTPQAITILLRAMMKNETFFHSLAVCGVDGSLEHKFHAETLTGRIIGKTGTLAGVSALSGFAVDAKGKPVYVFSLIVNGATGGKTFAAKSLEDACCEALVRATDAPAAPRP